MQEVVNCDTTIEALKKEVETVEAEKTRLAGEVVGLRVAHTRADFDNLQGKVESLGKELEGVKATE
jgi:predicted metal-dependent hydrolase